MINYDNLIKLLRLKRVSYSENWLRCECPLHNDHRPSFGIHLDSGYYKCFVCGSGTIDSLVSQVLDITPDSSKEWLLNNCALDPAEFRVFLLRTIHKSKPKTDPIPEQRLGIYRTRKLKHFSTLMKRGFTYDILETLEVGYDAIARRNTFPVRNSNGKLVGILGRSCKQNPITRWKVYYKFPKQRYVYNLNNCRHGAPLVLVEGLLDAARVMQVGETNVAALMGALPSAEQIDLIRDFGPSSITLVLDNDYAGYFGENLLINRLVQDVPLYTVQYPKSVKDPGEMSLMDLETLLEKRTNVISNRFMLLKNSNILF